MPVSETPTFEDLRQHIRASFLTMLEGGVDRLISTLVLPADRVTQLADMAQSALFLFAIKITEARGQQPTREHLMAAFVPLLASIRQEVPAFLRELADAHAVAHQLPRASLNDPL